MTLRFHPQAQDEFEESVAYYDAAREGLGLQFRDAVRQSLDRVTAAPEIGEARGVTRRLPVNGFPYHVVYRATLAEIVVIALAHHRRRPGYWRRRA